MKLFKNFQTKKQLREENKRLKAILLEKPQIYTQGIKLQEVREAYYTSCYEDDIPEEAIKNQIAKKMIDSLKPFIGYYATENVYGGKTYHGNLYVASKK